MSVLSEPTVAMLRLSLMIWLSCPHHMDGATDWPLGLGVTGSH